MSKQIQIFYLQLLIFREQLKFQMGNDNSKNKQILQKTNTQTQDKIDTYGLDIIQVSNLALAIKNKQPTINIEISLACENLPEIGLFDSSHIMVVCFKKEYYINSTEFQLLQIGRTQIIPKQLNPRFIQSFIHSYNEQKVEDIQFRIYDVDFDKLSTKSKDLSQHNLIGMVETNMQSIVDSQPIFIKQIVELKKRKKKSFLKIINSQYDGGNSKYSIIISAKGFASRQSLVFKLQVYRNNEWIPIFRGVMNQTQKQAKSQIFQIPTNKFPDQDRCRLKIKIFQYRAKGEIQLGDTQQISLADLLSKYEKIQYIKASKESYVVGHIGIHKFQKITRDSFISYIVNGAHLHLITAIDFSLSNKQNQKSLHDLQNDTNEYIEAMRQIIGVLQYFDYYNQIALYGFGAQLPPYYRTVGQCFALNGNFFQPIIVGGVQQLIKIYKQNLKKIRMHGPSRISEILELSYQFAKNQPQTTDYYVTVIFTDGNIADEVDAVKTFINSMKYPLSIIFVGIGNGQFEIIKRFIYNEEQRNLIEGQDKRNILQFIPFNKFQKDKSGKSIVKETFAEIPKQFIEYMKKKQIKPTKKNKKGLKNAKSQYLQKKIDSLKKGSTQVSKNVIFNSSYLSYKKNILKKSLQQLGFEYSPLLEKLQICLNDINYFIQVQSLMKQEQKQVQKNQKKVIYLKQTNRLDELIQKKEKQNQKKTLLKLEKNQTLNILKDTPKYSNKNIVEQQKQIKQNIIIQHPCVQCRKRQINIIYYQCGHACCCQQCRALYCQICRTKNTRTMKLITAGIE